MTAQVMIDLNVRVRGTQTFVGFEDVTGAISVGHLVEVVEPESDVRGPAVVTEIDVDRRLVYLAVEWANLRVRAGRTGTAKESETQHLGSDLHAQFLAIVEQAHPIASTFSSAKTNTTTEWGPTPHLPGGAYLTRFGNGPGWGQKLAARPGSALEVR